MGGDKENFSITVGERVRDKKDYKDKEERRFWKTN